jgi:D-3-phosphoglycerate dehydrogenase / 2-oxoglutarate reductase
MNRILITDDVHPILLEKLKLLDFEVDYQPKITYEEVKTKIRNCYGLIVNSKIIVDKEFLDLCSNLKFIGRLGSGMEIFDLDYAISKGIAIFNSPEGNRNAVAEHTLGMLLALSNKLNIADTEVRNFHWNREENRGFEIDSKTIGIIGFGNMGQAFAKKLKGFDVQILVYDKYLQSGYSRFWNNIVETDILSLQSQCDIISFHVPLNNETHHYCNESFLSKCKNGIIILNTSRGKILDTPSLIKNLENGKVKGACLDVFENEKVTTYTKEEKAMYSELFSFKNTVFTPHIAGWTMESKLKMSNTLLEKINSFLNK